MDLCIVYPLEEIRSYDILTGWLNALNGVGWLANQMLGQNNQTVWTGCTASQTGPASLFINLSEGWILDFTETNAVAYSDLGSNSTLVMQQGHALAAQQHLTTAGLSAGQSQYVLLQGTFAQSDVIPANDPNNGVLPYINPTDPTDPYSGPNNSNVPQDTLRAGVFTISQKYGTPTSGSPVAPTPDAGFVAMYLILLTFGQTTITTGQIALSNPTVQANAVVAPYFPGITSSTPSGANSSGSHHGGILGQGNKIVFTNGLEIQGISPLANLPVSNASPPTVGGNVTVSGDIPVLSQGTVIPNGNIAGNVNDLWLNTNGDTLWVCVTSGSSSTAVWAALPTTGISSAKSANFTAAPSFTYLCNTSSGDITVTLPLTSTFGGIPVGFKNIGTGKLILTPNAAENIEGYATAATQTLRVKGDFVRYTPGTGVWWIT